MSYGDKPLSPGTPLPAVPVAPPPTIASVQVKPSESDLIDAGMAVAATNPAFIPMRAGYAAMQSETPVKTFYEEFKDNLSDLWYGSDESNRRADAMIRGLAKAGTGLVDLATTVSPYNLLATPLGAPKIPETTAPVQNMLTQAGITKPQTATERTLETVTEYVSPVGMLRKIPVKALQTAIPLQAAAATSGGLAESAARESGATDIEQKAAGILTSLGIGLSPMALNRTKELLRGGATIDEIRDTLATFERIGTTPSVGQATGRTAQSFEQTLSNYPGGAGRIAGFGEQQQAAIGAKAEEMASGLSGARSVKAGRSIESGAKGFRDASVGFRKDSKATQLYNDADSLIGPNHRVSLDESMATLDEVTSIIPEMEKSSQAIANKGTLEIAESLKADIENARIQGKVGLPYESIKTYRTRIGRLISDSLFVPDSDTQQLRDLYRTLSLDVEKSFAGNPQALAKLKRADAYYRAAMNRLDDISKVINSAGGPEQVFMSAISGTKEGATTLTKIMRSLPLEQRKDVTSAMLYRMGRAKGGVATSEDFADQFSTETFLTNYNNLSKEAKLVLFGQPGYGKTFIQDMDAIVKASQKIRETSKYLVNTSGTARQTQFGSLFAALSGLPALAAGGVTESGIAAGITGATAAVTSAGGANLGARLMTNPRFVRWLAGTTKLPPKAGAAQVDLLAKANRDDEDIQEFVREYKSNVVVPTGGYGDVEYKEPVE